MNKHYWISQNTLRATFLSTMPERMIKYVGEHVQKRGLKRGMEPCYKDLYTHRPILGRWGPESVLMNGSWCPAGLARSFLKKWYRLFHTEWVPIGGNSMPPLAAKLNSKILGTGKDFLRRVKEQQRTDLGSQIWISRHQATGGPFNWTLIVHNLDEDSYIKYELCRVRKNDKKQDEIHCSKPETGRYGREYQFRSKPVLFDLDARDKHILQTGYPEDGTYHICLIGWTTLTRERIDEIGDKIMKYYVYSTLWNNCQGFLKKLFNSIRNRRAPDAADLSWFKKNMRTEYQNKKELMSTGDASRRIAIGQLNELRIRSHYIESADITLSTQQLATIQDATLQNMINPQAIQNLQRTQNG